MQVKLFLAFGADIRRAARLGETSAPTRVLEAVAIDRDGERPDRPPAPASQARRPVAARRLAGAARVLAEPGERGRTVRRPALPPHRSSRPAPRVGVVRVVESDTARALAAAFRAGLELPLPQVLDVVA